MQATFPEHQQVVPCQRLDIDVALCRMLCSQRKFCQVSSKLYSRRAAKLRPLLWKSSDKNILERRQKPATKLAGTTG